MRQALARRRQYIELYRSLHMHARGYLPAHGTPPPALRRALLLPGALGCAAGSILLLRYCWAHEHPD
jgi:hypothetical protein